MRLLSTLLALSMALPAFADARLKLVSDRPIVIVVNMVPHTVDADSPAIIDFPRGKEGVQRVTVRNLAGQVMHQGNLIVPESEVVVAGWIDREFQVTERKVLKTSDAFNRRGGKKGPAGHKRLDALSAQQQESTDLLSLAASDGTTEDAPPPDTGTDSEPAEQVTAEGDGHSFTEGKGTAETVETKDLAASGDGDVATVKLYPRTQSWANVWIDGEKVWEFRAKSDVLELTVPSGTHSLTVKDFRDKDTWGTGTLTVTSGQTATIQFSMADPIEVKGGAWATQ